MALWAPDSSNLVSNSANYSCASIGYRCPVGGAIAQRFKSLTAVLKSGGPAFMYTFLLFD